MSRAGLTIVPFVPWDQLPNFYHAVLRLNVGRCSVRLNVTSTKNVVNFLGEEKCNPRENRGYAYEKRAPPYVGVGPRPRMVNPALHVYEVPVAEFMRVSIIVRDSFGSFAFHRRSELYCGLNDCLTVSFFFSFLCRSTCTMSS